MEGAARESDDVSGSGGDDSPGSNATRQEWHFTSAGLLSKSVMLNGNVLKLLENTMPPVPPRMVNVAAPIVIEPLSYGFVVANLGVSACSQ